jgi:glutathione synthase/RimK-type ligase-like ATP-grasp enzyme
VILLISHLGDAHAVQVLERLRRDGAEAVLLDTGCLPRDIGLTVRPAGRDGWRGFAFIDGREVDLAAVGAAWWRRPLPFGLDDAVTGAEDRAFAFGEVHAAVAGLWSCLEARWINPPDADERAGRKLHQLKLATALGLRTPRTCVTSRPEDARAFLAEEGDRGVIYKAFSATEQAWRETRLLRADEAERLDAVRFAPVIFQEYVRAELDLRITMIDGEAFAAEIWSQQTDYPFDFRMRMHAAEMRPHALPSAVLADLRRLMGALDLVYGAIDMRLTPEGEYVFLEVNPAGQWLFIEERTGQPITDALCAALKRFAERIETAKPDLRAA